MSGVGLMVLVVVGGYGGLVENDIVGMFKVFMVVDVMMVVFRVNNVDGEVVIASFIEIGVMVFVEFV